MQRCADQELPLYDPLEPGEPPPLPAQAAPVREIVSTVVDTARSNAPWSVQRVLLNAHIAVPGDATAAM